MRTKPYYLILSLALPVLFTWLVSNAVAQERPSPEERAYQFRTSLFQTFSWKLGQLFSAQAQQDQSAFTKHARDLVVLAKMTEEGFQIENNIPEGSRAKPEIWSDYQGFQQKNQALIDAAQALVQDGAMADFNVREFGSQNCGACHRNYRVKDQ